MCLYARCPSFGVILALNTLFFQSQAGWDLQSRVLLLNLLRGAKQHCTKWGFFLSTGASSSEVCIQHSPNPIAQSSFPWDLICSAAAPEPHTQGEGAGEKLGKLGRATPGMLLWVSSLLLLHTFNWIFGYSTPGTPKSWMRGGKNRQKRDSTKLGKWVEIVTCRQKRGFSPHPVKPIPAALSSPICFWWCLPSSAQPEQTRSQTTSY